MIVRLRRRTVPSGNLCSSTLDATICSTRWSSFPRTKTASPVIWPRRRVLLRRSHRNFVQDGSLERPTKSGPLDTGGPHDSAKALHINLAQPPAEDELHADAALRADDRRTAHGACANLQRNSQFQRRT